MTAAGLAFIAAGLATLISFRSVLFGGGERRARRRRPEAAVPARVPVDEPQAARRRRLAEAFSGRPAEEDPGPSTLAAIGLADDEEDEEQRVEAQPAHDDAWPPRRRRRDPEPDGPAWARRDAEDPMGYAGRYRSPHDEDWDRPPVGDYWTPVPDDLFSASAIGVLPPVPDYQPATGFDLPPVPAEPPPAAPAPEWPMREHRVRLPRSWSERDSQPRHGLADSGRPSPRPRPATPYVSRHSAP